MTFGARPAAGRRVALFVPGGVLVADMTDPNWEPIMKRASAIVTNRGWRTCHAAILPRELGIPAVVGTGTATFALADGREVTVPCAEGDTGFVYDGLRECTVTERLCCRCPGDRAEHDARWNPGAMPGRRLGPPSRSSCGRRTLGLARDSALVAGSFGGRDPAVKVMLTGAIKACLTQGTYVGICGHGTPTTPTSPTGWSARASSRSRSTPTRSSTPGCDCRPALAEPAAPGHRRRPAGLSRG